MRSISTLVMAIAIFSTIQTRAQGLSNPIISEFHYEDVSNDADEIEQIEIFGKSGTNLSNFRIYLYGQNGKVSSIIPLSGIIPPMITRYGVTYGVLVFTIDNMDNDKTGICLAMFDGQNWNSLEWISYEGTINAKDGPADNQTSDDVGARETGSTTVASSLWRPSAQNANFSVTTQNSFGAVNTGIIPITLKQFSVSLKNDQALVKWSATNTNPDSYYEVERSTDQRNYKTLTRMRSTGVGDFNYVYTDNKPVKGNAYYRLKLIDPEE
ncbi:MAG TPA: hypothetical protein VM012_11415, partial [Flavitalea sp.]|nr:hypothetical protein [Flavitalea sp.]